MSGFQFFVSLVLGIVLSILAVTLPGRLYSNKKLEKLDKFINGLKNPRKISKVINVIWIILFIPVTFLCLVAAVGVLMGGEGMLGSIGVFQIICIGISLILFLLNPIIIIFSITLSWVYRKNDKITLSIIIQFVPLIILLMAILFIIAVGLLGMMNIKI